MEVDGRVEKDKSNEKSKVQPLTESEWIKLCRTMLHTGFDPANEKYLQILDHPLLLPMYEGDSEATNRILYSKSRNSQAQLCLQPRYPDIIWMDSQNVLYNEIANWNTRLASVSNRPGSRSCPGKQAPTVKPVILDKRFLHLGSMDRPGWSWTFAHYSATVESYVATVGNLKLLDQRVGQLCGCLDLPLVDTSRLTRTIRTFAWQKILFCKLWSFLAAKLDPATNMEQVEKVFYRSHAANLQLWASQVLATIVYHEEGTAYGVKTDEESLRLVEHLLQRVESRIWNSLPETVRKNPDELKREIDHELYTLACAARAEGFNPYRYCHRRNAHGTGNCFFISTKG